MAIFGIESRALSRSGGGNEARAQFYSTVGLGMLDMAITIVRSCDPAETEEYRRQAREEIASWDTTGRSALPTVAFFADHVTRARRWLPKNDPYLSKVLGGMSGEEFLKAGQTGGREGPSSDPRGASLVYSREQRNALVRAGWKAIQECDDVAIAAARQFVILIRENQKINADLVAQEESLFAEMGQGCLSVLREESQFRCDIHRALYRWSCHRIPTQRCHRAAPYDVRRRFCSEHGVSKRDPFSTPEDLV